MRRTQLVSLSGCRGKEFFSHCRCWLHQLWILSRRRTKTRYCAANGSARHALLLTDFQPDLPSKLTIRDQQSTTQHHHSSYEPKFSNGILELALIVTHVVRGPEVIVGIVLSSPVEVKVPSGSCSFNYWYFFISGSIKVP